MLNYIIPALFLIVIGMLVWHVRHKRHDHVLFGARYIGGIKRLLRLK